VTSSYPHHEETGDACAPFAREFAEELAEHARVTVVAAGPQSETITEQGVKVVRFRTPVFPVSRLRFGHPWDWLAIVDVLRSGQVALKRELACEPADFILAFWAIPAGLWAMRAAARCHVPYGVWALGSDILIAGKSPLIRPIVRKVLNNANIRFADGLALKEEVERLSGPCRFLPTTRRLPATSRKCLRKYPPFRLSFIGRWHPVKGVDLLMEALQLLDDEDWARIESVRIFGDGILAKQLEKTCGLLQQASRPVILEGLLDKDGVAHALLEADYLLIPSRSESIPVVFSEAMQMQCPIIATPVGDLPLLQQRYNVGWVAHDVSAEALAAAIHSALDSAPHHLQDGLRHAAKAFDLSRSVQAMLAEAPIFTAG